MMAIFREVGLQGKARRKWLGGCFGWVCGGLGQNCSMSDVGAEVLCNPGEKSKTLQKNLQPRTLNPKPEDLDGWAGSALIGCEMSLIEASGNRWHQPNNRHPESMPSPYPKFIPKPLGGFPN